MELIKNAFLQSEAFCNFGTHRRKSSSIRAYSRSPRRIFARPTREKDERMSTDMREEEETSKTGNLNSAPKAGAIAM